MHYVIEAWENGDGEEPTRLQVPARHDLAEYARSALLPRLRPIDPDTFRHSLNHMVGTAAKSVYFIENGALFWCVDWFPLLILVRFDPDQSIAAEAFRQPTPQHDEPLPGEEPWDEDEDGLCPLYSLIYAVWDYQFDARDRAHIGAEPIHPELDAIWAGTIEWLDAIGVADNDDWKQRLNDWTGTGLPFRRPHDPNASSTYSPSPAALSGVTRPELPPQHPSKAAPLAGAVVAGLVLLLWIAATSHC